MSSRKFQQSLWLLLLLVSVYCQEPENIPGPVPTEPAAEAEVTADKSSPAANRPTNGNPTNTTPTRPDDMLAQSLLSPTAGLPMFSYLFPALGSLLLWGSRFPAERLLGSNQELSPAASKVVLVLADDVNQNSLNGKRRQVRQDSGSQPSGDSAPPAPPASLLSQILDAAANRDPRQFWAGPQLGQSLQNLQPGLGLGSLISPENLNLPQLRSDALNFNIQPILGSSLSQGLSDRFPGLDLSQSPLMTLFGQSQVGSAREEQAMSNGETVPTKETPPDETSKDPSTPTESSAQPRTPQSVVNPLFQQFPSFLSGGLLRPGNSDNILGQALNVPPPSEATSAILARIRDLWTTPQNAAAADGTQAEATDISEVRVRPDGSYVEQHQPDDKYAQMKMKTALQDALERKSVPLLWFRMPTYKEYNERKASDFNKSPKSLEDIKIESKIHAFERQVIAELKLLQKIEQMAKEMRARASDYENVNTLKDSTSTSSPYKITYPLSKTPIHKITRDDIERSLRDDYVRKLLQKELQQKTQTTAAEYVHSGNSYLDENITKKRQIMPTEHHISKEDLVKMMAYAYRIASENDESSAPKSFHNERSNKGEQQYTAYRVQQQDSNTQPQMNTQQTEQMMNFESNRQWADNSQMAQQRQWSVESQKMPQNQPMMMMMQPQWAEQQQQQQQQQRQWADEMAQQQTQRQWAEERVKQQQQQLQWAEDMKRQQQQLQAQQQMRQWADNEEQTRNTESKKGKTEQINENEKPTARQWIEETEGAKVQTIQGPMAREKQWADDKLKQTQEMQQRQWINNERAEQQKSTDTAVPSQRSWAERQWIDDKSINMDSNFAQQRQWAEGQKVETKKESATASQGATDMQKAKEERQWAEKTPEISSSNQPTVPTQTVRQWSEPPRDELQPEKPLNSLGDMQVPQQMEQPPSTMLVGEAMPQTAENVGKARFKGNLYGVFRSNYKLFLPDSFQNGREVNEWDILGLGGDKRKKAKLGGPTIVNYYYNPSSGGPYAPAGGSSYQNDAYGPAPVTSSYGAGYHSGIVQGGGSSFSGTYGGGGYGSNAYGGASRGGGYGSTAYGSISRGGGYGGHSGGYRAAVGNDEIDAMLRAHQTMPKIKTTDQRPTEIHERNEDTDQDSPITTIRLENSSTSTQSPQSLKSPSSVTTPTDPAIISSDTPSSPEIVGSIFSYKDSLLHPYMGLLPISRPDDPWNYKPYDPQRPIFGGGGSYEAYLREGRYKRDTHIMSGSNTFTPNMLERLLRIKKEFQRQHPQLYKSMLEHHRNSTRISILPPIIPNTANYPILELAATEKDPNVSTLSAEENEGMRQKGNKKSLKTDADGDFDYFYFDDGDD